MVRPLRIGSKAEVIKTLRELLHVTGKRSSQAKRRDCPWTQQLLSQYRARQFETDRAKMREYRTEANDLLMLLKGVQEQRYLWDLDAGAEKKLTGQEIVNRSAKRVGLFVPETYADREDKEKAAKAAAYLAAKKAKELEAAAAAKKE